MADLMDYYGWDYPGSAYDPYATFNSYSPDYSSFADSGQFNFGALSPVPDFGGYPSTPGLDYSNLQSVAPDFNIPSVDFGTGLSQLDYSQLPEGGGLPSTFSAGAVPDLSGSGFRADPSTIPADYSTGGMDVPAKQNWFTPVTNYLKDLGKETAEGVKQAGPLRTLGALGSLGLMGAGILGTNKGSEAQRKATEMALKQQQEQERLLGPYRQVLAQRIQAAQSGDLASAIPNEYRQGQEYLGRTEAELRRAFGPQAASSTAFQNAMANAQQKVQGMYTDAVNKLMSTGGQILTSSYGPSNQTLSTLGGLAAQSSQADRQRNQGLLQAGGLLGGMVARWPDTQQQRKATT